MSRSVCLFLALSLASAGRVTINKVDEKTSATAPSVTGNHKCTITWSKPGKDDASRVTMVFGVSAKMKCKLASNGPRKMFGSSLVFTPKQQGGKCACMSKDEKTQITYFVGQCAAGAEEKCWTTYLEDVTSDIIKQPDRRTPTVKRNHALMGDNTFDYGVEEDTCAESCFKVEVPPTDSSLTAEEQEVVDETMKKIESGAVRVSSLDDVVKRKMISVIEPEREIWETLQSELDVKAVTVAMLKASYETKLATTGISVDHMLIVAGLNPEAGTDEVNFDQFKKFLNPAC